MRERPGRTLQDLSILLPGVQLRTHSGQDLSQPSPPPHAACIRRSALGLGHRDSVGGHLMGRDGELVGTEHGWGGA